MVRLGDTWVCVIVCVSVCALCMCVYSKNCFIGMGEANIFTSNNKESV